MGRTLDTIIEVDVSDDEMSSNATKGHMKSACQTFNIMEGMTLGKEIDFDSFIGLSDRVVEICEPDSELDPETKDDTLPKEVQATTRRRKRSLIDKAFKDQQKQQLQEAQADAEQQLEPAYIWITDLAADWSCYIPKLVTTFPQNPSHVNTSMEDADVQPTVCQLQAPEADQEQTASSLVSSGLKRNRKKSLIDKAASRQRKELAAQCKQVESRETRTTYCSLCEGRKNRSSCGLCGARS
jgi:hypothetical protein